MYQKDRGGATFTGQAPWFYARYKTSRAVLAEITAIIHSSKPATPLEKLTRIETLVNTHNAQSTENDQIHIMKFEQTLTKIANNQFHFDSLEDVSRTLFFSKHFKACTIHNDNQLFFGYIVLFGHNKLASTP